MMKSAIELSVVFYTGILRAVIRLIPDRHCSVLIVNMQTIVSPPAIKVFEVLHLRDTSDYVIGVAVKRAIIDHSYHVRHCSASSLPICALAANEQGQALIPLLPHSSIETHYQRQFFRNPQTGKIPLPRLLLLHFSP